MSVHRTAYQTVTDVIITAATTATPTPLAAAAMVAAARAFHCPAQCGGTVHPIAAGESLWQCVACHHSCSTDEVAAMRSAEQSLAEALSVQGADSVAEVDALLAEAGCGIVHRHHCLVFWTLEQLAKLLAGELKKSVLSCNC
jgi:hypothetical protein